MTPHLDTLEPLRLFAATVVWQPLGEPGSGGWITSVQVSPHDGRQVLVGGDMLGAALSGDGGRSWGGGTGFRSWEIGDFTFHPTDLSIAWAGSMSGPYKSIDGGRTWIERRVGMPTGNFYAAPVQKVLFDPNNPARLLAFGGSHREWGNNSTTAKYGGVWESTNGADSWTLKATIEPDVNGKGGNVMAAAFAPGSSAVVYAAVKDKGVYKSTNGGASWVRTSTGLPSNVVNNLVVHPTDADTLWVSLSGGGAVYKSTNGGASWSASNTGLPQQTSGWYKGLAVGETNPNVLYVSNGDYGTGSDGVWRSTNGGTSWTKVVAASRTNWSAAYPAGPGLTWIEIDPRNANRVFAAGSEYVLRTDDGGATWTDVTASRPTADTGLWRGHGYSGLVSVNGSWNPYRRGQITIQAMDAGKMWVSNDDGATWRRQSGLSAWGGGNDVTYSQSDPNLMYATFGQFGHYDAIGRSTDGGATWSAVTKPTNATGHPLSIYMHPTQNGRLWVTVGGQLYSSTNGGSSWSAVTISGATNLGWIVGDPLNPLTMYVSASQGIYRSTNGTSFTLMSGSPTNGNGRDTRIEIDPSNTGRLYVANWRAGSNPGVHRYVSGSGWTRISANSMAASVAVDPADANRVMFITNDHPYHDFSFASGVYMTENALATTPTWTPRNDDLPMLRGEVIEFDPGKTGRVLIGTYGRGYFIGQVLPELRPPLVGPAQPGGVYYDDRNYPGWGDRTRPTVAKDRSPQLGTFAAAGWETRVRPVRDVANAAEGEPDDGDDAIVRVWKHVAVGVLGTTGRRLGRH